MPALLRPAAFHRAKIKLLRMLNNSSFYHDIFNGIYEIEKSLVTAEAGMLLGQINETAREGNFRGTLWLNGVGRSEDFLQEGQAVRAEVIFAADSTAHVRLDNGTVLRARLSNGVMLAEGDTVLLSVKANSGERLWLQIVPDLPVGAAPEESAAAALSKTGLPPTPQNLTLAAAFHEAGLPVTAEDVKQAASILEAFPDAGTSAAVFAAANKLDARPENLGILRSLQQPDFKADAVIARIFRLLAGQSELPVHEGRQGMSGQTNPVYITNVPAPALSDAPIREGRSGGLTTRPEPDTGRESAALPDSAELSVWEQLTEAGSGVTDRGKWLGLLQAAKHSFFAEIEKPEDANALKKAGEQLPGRLEILKNLAEASPGKAKSAAAEADRLISGLKLLQAIDKYSYIQIPVILGGRPSTVALAVFRQRRGTKKKAPGSTTLLIALETKNLGHIEALVSITNDNISIRFNLSDIEITDYLRNRTTALYHTVSLSGYRLSGVSFHTAKEPVTPLTVLKTIKEDMPSRKINIRV
jgi:hypothetical protein